MIKNEINLIIFSLLRFPILVRTTTREINITFDLPDKKLESTYMTFIRMIILEDSTRYCMLHLYANICICIYIYEIVADRYKVYKHHKKCIHVTIYSPWIVVHPIYYERGKVIKTKHTYMETKEIFSRPNFLNGLLMRF